MATSPDGALVYLAGTRYVEGQGIYESIIVAYDSATGEQVWLATHTDSAIPQPRIESLSATGDRVFVTGFDPEPGTGFRDGRFSAFTIAFDAITGEQEWTSTEAGLAAFSLAVAPGGSELYVGGSAVTTFPDGSFRVDGRTLAYDSETGGLLWRSELPGVRGEIDRSIGQDYPDGSVIQYGLAVHPSGTRVFASAVTYGTLIPEGSRPISIGVAAYQARGNDEVEPGEQLAFGSHPLATRSGPGTAISISPDGSKVFVVDWARPPEGCLSVQALTVAFDAITGAALWEARTGDCSWGNIPWQFDPMAVSPDSSSLYVAYMSTALCLEACLDRFEVAVYDTSSGALTGKMAYTLPSQLTHCTFCGPLIELDDSGRNLYLTGYTNGWGVGGIPITVQATVAFDAMTHQQRWAALDEPWDTHPWQDAFGNRARGLTVSPDGSRVFVGTGVETSHSDQSLIALSFDT